MAKFINQQESWDGGKIVKVGEEVNFSAELGDYVPSYYEPADDEAKAMTDAYAKTQADAAQAVADAAAGAQTSGEDDSHDDIDSDNPYKDTTVYSNIQKLKDELDKRQVDYSKAKSRADYEALLVGNDKAQADAAQAKVQAQAIVDAQAQAKFDALKGVAVLFDIQVEDADTADTLQTKIEEKQVALSNPVPQKNDETGTGDNGSAGNS